jgi:hypothetical protein
MLNKEWLNIAIYLKETPFKKTISIVKLRLRLKNKC